MLDPLLLPLKCQMGSIETLFIELSLLNLAIAVVLELKILMN